MWRSLWNQVAISSLMADVTFVLTSGGHNAGIVSEPGHRRRHFRIAYTPSDAAYRDAAQWFAETGPEEGSW